MATKKKAARTAGQLAYDKRRAALKKAGKKATKKTVKRTAKKASPLKGRKLGPRTKTTQQVPAPDALVTDQATDAQQAEGQIEGAGFEDKSNTQVGGVELEKIDILDMRGLPPVPRIAILGALEGMGFLSTLLSQPTHLEVLPKFLSVDYLALNHQNKLIREANPDEVSHNTAISVPSVRVNVELAFSEPQPQNPLTIEVGGATYLRVG